MNLPLDEVCTVVTVDTKPNEPRVIAVPDFVPIETDCPLWGHTARALIQGHVPERLTFKVLDDPTIVNVDYGFVQRLYDAAPPEDRAAFFKRITVLSTLLLEVIDQAPFQEFMGTASTIWAVQRMTNLLWEQNMRRLYHHLPSFEGLIHHVLGSMPWWDYDATRRW